MFKDAEKKKMYIEWRLDLLQEMKGLLEGFKILGSPELMDKAKKCGIITKHLKHRIDGVSCNCIEDYHKELSPVDA